MNERRRQKESTKHVVLVNQVRRTIQRDSNKTLRRISIVIWVLVAGCFVLAAVVWTLLLYGSP